MLEFGVLKLCAESVSATEVVMNEQFYVDILSNLAFLLMLGFLRENLLEEI